MKIIFKLMLGLLLSWESHALASGCFGKFFFVRDLFIEHLADLDQDEFILDFSGTEVLARSLDAKQSVVFTHSADENDKASQRASFEAARANIVGALSEYSVSLHFSNRYYVLESDCEPVGRRLTGQAVLVFTHKQTQAEIEFLSPSLLDPKLPKTSAFEWEYLAESWEPQ